MGQASHEQRCLQPCCPLPRNHALDPGR
jgi:hypothetical protein